MSKRVQGGEERDGQEPLEDVSVAECDANPTLCGTPPGELDGPPHESQVEFREETSEPFQMEQLAMGLSPVDGLPIPLDESPNLAFAPPFSIDTVICVEDDRSYVEVFAEQLRPEEKAALRKLNATNRKQAAYLLAADAVIAAVLLVFGAPWYIAVGVLAVSAALVVPGLLRRFLARSSDSAHGPMEFKPQSINRDGDAQYVRFTVALLSDARGSKRGLGFAKGVIVRPTRETCVHYKRQMFANDDAPDPKDPGHKLIFRNCTKRQSVGGAFMSLRDEAVYACDYRSPPDPQSKVKLDGADADIMRKCAERTMVPLFNITRQARRPQDRGNTAPRIRTKKDEATK